MQPLIVENKQMMIMMKTFFPGIISN